MHYLESDIRRKSTGVGTNRIRSPLITSGNIDVLYNVLHSSCCFNVCLMPYLFTKFTLEDVDY